MKRILSFFLAAAVTLTAAMALAGCASAEYPVEIANITIEKEPKNIVVLDPNIADMIAFMGMDGKIVGISDSVDQTELKAAPGVGGSVSPSVSKIKEAEADIVFAGDDISEKTVKELADNNITVVKMTFAETPTQLQINYKTLGKILCGEKAGEQKGAAAYNKLVLDLKDIQDSIPVKDSKTDLTSDTVCYLYFENNNLKIMTRDSYGEMLLEYTNCINVASNITEASVDAQVLREANPKYVFYANDETLQAIKTNVVLSRLPAVTAGRMLQITDKEMKRQGGTATKTVKRMVDFIYNGKISTPDEPASPVATQPTTIPVNQQATQAASQAVSAQAAQPASNAAQPASQPVTGAAGQAVQTTQAADGTANSTSVAAQYKIDLTTLSLKKDDKNANVKIMQKRLYDLGYINDAENVTGYYGNVSEKAVKDFQQASGIRATGAADNATLVKLFDKTAKKAS